MQTLEPIWQKVRPFFKDFEESLVETHGWFCLDLVFPRRTMIFRHGERADRFYLMQEGQVAVKL